MLMVKFVGRLSRSSKMLSGQISFHEGTGKLDRLVFKNQNTTSRVEQNITGGLPENLEIERKLIGPCKQKITPRNCFRLRASLKPAKENITSEFRHVLIKIPVDDKEVDTA